MGRPEQKTSRSSQDEDFTQSSNSQSGNQTAPRGAPLISQLGRLESLKNSSEPPKSAHGSETPRLRKIRCQEPSVKQKTSRNPTWSYHVAVHCVVLLRRCTQPGREAGLGTDQTAHFCLQTEKDLCLLLHWEDWSQTYYFSHKGLIICSSYVDASSQCVEFFTSKFLKEKKKLSGEKCCQHGKVYGGYLNLVLKALPFSSQGYMLNSDIDININLSLILMCH